MATCSLPFSNILRHSAFQSQWPLIDNVTDHRTFVRYERGWAVENVLEEAKELEFLYHSLLLVKVLFLLLKFHFLVFNVKSHQKQDGKKKKKKLLQFISSLNNFWIWLDIPRSKANWLIIVKFAKFGTNCQICSNLLSSENFVSNSSFLMYFSKLHIQ